MQMDKNVNIGIDIDGRRLVIINDIRFRSRRKIDWQKVEKYLKKYIGECFEILETSEKNICWIRVSR